MKKKIIDIVNEQAGHRLSYIFYNIITRSMQDRIDKTTNYNRLHMNFRKSTRLHSIGMYFNLEYRYILIEMCEHIDSP